MLFKIKEHKYIKEMLVQLSQLQQQMTANHRANSAIFESFYKFNIHQHQHHF